MSLRWSHTPYTLAWANLPRPRNSCRHKRKWRAQGVFSKRYPIPDDKVHQGHRIPTTFWSKNGIQWFHPSLSGSRQQHKHCTKKFPKLRQRYPKLRHLWIIMSPHVTTPSWVTKMRWYTCIGVFPSWKKKHPSGTFNDPTIRRRLWSCRVWMRKKTLQVHPVGQRLPLLWAGCQAVPETWRLIPLDTSTYMYTKYTTREGVCRWVCHVL